MNSANSTQKKQYHCFSYKQKEYLIELGFTVVSIDRHFKTNKTFWTFELNDSLSDALTVWSNSQNLYKGTFQIHNN